MTSPIENHYHQQQPIDQNSDTSKKADNRHMSAVALAEMDALFATTAKESSESKEQGQDPANESLKQILIDLLIKFVQAQIKRKFLSANAININDILSISLKGR